VCSVALLLNFVLVQFVGDSKNGGGEGWKEDEIKTSSGLRPIARAFLLVV